MTRQTSLGSAIGALVDPAGKNTDAPLRPKRPRRGVWTTIRAGIGAALGLLPHIMHHVGLLAGAAVLTGVLGNTMLYVVGLILSVPLFNRLRTRFHSAWAPVIGIAIFTALFALSAFVVGPAISGVRDEGPARAPTPVMTSSDAHTDHH